MAQNRPHILAFSASSSKASINKTLVTHASQILQQDIDPSADVEIIDLNDYEMPIYSIDQENNDGIPQLAKDFFDKIGAADALLISYAEHNGYYTAAFKNIFDWCSRIEMKVFQDKPMVIMSASIGPGGGGNVLKTALESAQFFGADIKGNLKVGPFSQKFDVEANVLSDPELAAELREALTALRPNMQAAA